LCLMVRQGREGVWGDEECFDGKRKGCERECVWGGDEVTLDYVFKFEYKKRFVEWWTKITRAVMESKI